MLTQDGTDIVPLDRETVFYRQSGVRLELDSSNGGYPGAGSSYNSKNGTLLLTNQRVVYICAEPTAYFSSASLPINSIEDSKLTAPWFSAPAFKAVVMPVPRGGLTQPARLTIWFTQGSLSEFELQYRSLKDRLQELDGHAPEHLEQLPVYEAPLSSSSAATATRSDPGPSPYTTGTSSAPLPQPLPHPTSTNLGTVPAASSSNAPQSSTMGPAGENLPPPPHPEARPTAPGTTPIPTDLPPQYDDI
ncbi:hypothetical protein BGW38_009341 [Lunasporangiospora selenospora]|uniref:GRAM domain-containing protein n=1 Tax=Lunasporangiospora selenospora TaxID=979761 RepID=A0A9P6KFY8_9FUNG|nr:hypothetical protein BGW38_009341 [Lunasporangiospora selenospora]